MIFALNDLFTWSFWRHILWTKHTWLRALQVLGVLSLITELLRNFDIVQLKGFTPLIGMVILSCLAGATARFPVQRISYRIPKRDLEIEVRIADLFSVCGNIVISTISSFDTDIENGIIARDSLQGQFTAKVLGGDAHALDQEIEKSLLGKSGEDVGGVGKLKRYPLGTVAVIRRPDRTYYLLAMAHLNMDGTARTPPQGLYESLTGLWDEIAERGELGDVAVPVIGTGRGRLAEPRQKIIEVIAQTFADASRDRKVANRLIIVVSPADAAKWDINLFQVRDYLALSLSV